MKLRFNFNKFFFISVLAISVGCSKSTDRTTASSEDIEEYGQQMGDLAASVDEMGSSNGTLAFQEEAPLSDQVETQASCFGAGFGSCSSNVITRNFGDCTVRSATVSGTVTLTWGGSSSNCGLSAIGDSITRSPNFTVTGLRGATLEVTKTGSVGQRLTWASGSGTSKVFELSNDGIRRKFTSSGGTVLFDMTTTITSPVTVNKTSRLAGRTLNGGTFRITNNLSGVVCDVSPTNVTWELGCNCPTSGSWSGTCDDDQEISLTINSCTTGTLQVGSSQTSLIFDRCAGS